MATNFAKDFKLYENLFSKQKKQSNTKKVLKESRSPDEIQAEIDRLTNELQQAKVAEKSSTYTKFPTELYAWDMYIDKKDKGDWCSAEKEDGTWDGMVYETEEDAINGAITLLGEVADEGELEGDPDEYTIDTIPITELTIEDLEYSDLEHLIPAIIK